MEHCAEQRIGGMAGVAQQTRGGCGDEQDGYQNEQGKCSHLLLLLLQISFYSFPVPRKKRYSLAAIGGRIVSRE